MRLLRQKSQALLKSQRLHLLHLHCNNIRKLRWTAKRTQVAQRLYENGWITYMRTDSTNLSDQVKAARPHISSSYGAQYSLNLQ